MSKLKIIQDDSTVITIKRVFEYIVRGHKSKFLFVLVSILINVIANVAGSLFIRILIDEYITPLLGVSNPVMTSLYYAISIMGFIYLLGVVFGYLYNRIMIQISQSVQREIRNDMFSKMQSLPIEYFDTNSFGDIMSRYTNDIDTLRQAISQSMPALLSSIIMIVMVLTTMAITSIPLTLLVVFMSFIIIQVMKYFSSKSGKYFVKQQNDIGDLNGYIEEMMNGQRVIKVFTYEHQVKNIFVEKNRQLFKSVNNANRYINMVLPISMNLANLMYVLVAIIGGILSVSGMSGLSLGAIASFLQLTRSFNQPVSQISQQMNSVIVAIAGAKRIFEVIDSSPEVDDGKITLVNAIVNDYQIVESDKYTGQWAWKEVEKKNVKYTLLRGDVRFEDVIFSYDGIKTVLNNISLYAKPGQKIAFVGATGSGKTTIINLINRLYEIEDGNILYDGINIKDIRKSDLRRSLGIVLQDVNLFTGTVMENIRYGNLNASDEDVVSAAKLAEVHDIIERLPQGYQTILTGDGSGLSQGQRQLLSIARAAVSNPPVMILDEATSSIDTRTEKSVQRGMDNLMKGRTVFVIAHRLSTINNSKAIMFLQDGEIVERGNHQQLLELKGKYYQLFTGIFELE